MDVFTLVSGDYVHGAAALCNSLCAAGFRGTIHVGYVGEIEWSIDATAPIATYQLPESDKWFGSYKPAFIADHANGAYAYIDADCIITTPELIQYVVEIIPKAPVLCAEAIIPATDIRRFRWQQTKERCLGTVGSKPFPDLYYNSGFFCGEGLRDKWMLDGWKKIMSGISNLIPGQFENRDFPLPDQDCFNALIQDEQAPFFCVSPPDIWYAASPTNPFFHVGTREGALLHCTGREKPWRHKSVPARAPNRYERAWHHYVYEDAPWVRCSPNLGSAVRSWLTGGIRGRAISKAKGLTRRLSF